MQQPLTAKQLTEPSGPTSSGPACLGTFTAVDWAKASIIGLAATIAGGASNEVAAQGGAQPNRARANDGMVELVDPTSATAALGGERTWSGMPGGQEELRSFQAEFFSFDGSIVRFKMGDRLVQLPLSRLGERDRALIISEFQKVDTRDLQLWTTAAGFQCLAELTRRDKGTVTLQLLDGREVTFKEGEVVQGHGGRQEAGTSETSPLSATELIGQPVSSDPAAHGVCESLDVIMARWEGRRRGALPGVSMTILPDKIWVVSLSGGHVSFFDVKEPDWDTVEGFGAGGDGSEWFGRPSHIAAELRGGREPRLYLTNEAGVRILEPRALQEELRNQHPFKLVGTIDSAEQQGDLKDGAAAGVAFRGNRLWVVNQQLGCLHEFDTRNRKFLRTIGSDLNKPGPVVVSGDGSFIAVGEREDGAVKVFDSDGQLRFVVSQPQEPSEFLALFFLPNSNDLVVYRGSAETSEVYRVGK